ncbi:4Fe-4S binding protein [candidate division WOR-3 bacterium]|nr:4Fe-4S binding protein [candidate division WOR-3 bacterium]
MAKLKSWKELPCGAIIEDMKAVRENKTGAWRSVRPCWNKDKCIQCLNCWIFCPDAAVIVEDGKVTGINYDYCKGCGICANVCPTKVQAITMEEERK